MTTPHTTEQVEVEGVDFKTIGRSGTYVDQVMVHETGKTSNAIGNGKRYIVEVTNGKITRIVTDFAKLKQDEAKALAKEQKEAVAKKLAEATSYAITWVDNFHDHTTSLTESKRSEFVEQFLQDAEKRIESSKSLGEFALLVTDPTGDPGSGISLWRLCGRIIRTSSTGVVSVRLWHYGPGSQH